MKVYWRVEQNVNGIKTVDTYERQHSDELSADVYELYLNTKPNVVSACRISKIEFKKTMESVRKNGRQQTFRKF